MYVYMCMYVKYVCMYVLNFFNIQVTVTDAQTCFDGIDNFETYWSRFCRMFLCGNLANFLIPRIN